MFGEARQAGTLVPLRSHPSRRLASVPDFIPHPAREHFQLLLATAQGTTPLDDPPLEAFRVVESDHMGEKVSALQAGQI